MLNEIGFDREPPIFSASCEPLLASALLLCCAVASQGTSTARHAAAGAAAAVTAAIRLRWLTGQVRRNSRTAAQRYAALMSQYLLSPVQSEPKAMARTE